MTTAGDRDDIGTGRGGILAILPFLVKGALSLIVLRAMRARGLDITVAYTMPEAVGYTRDPLEDFAADERLLDLTAATDAEAVALVLERCARIDARLVLQVGSPIAYRWLPALRQRLPGAALLDILYNPVGHVTNHFLHERTFDGAIVESRAMERFYRENSVHCDPVIHVVESGIDLGHYSMPGSFPERPLTVGWVGRMSPEKNPLGFIRLAEAAHAEMPQLRFAMFGEGPMSDEVRAAVDGSPAHPALSFEGWAESARDCFRAVDILVVPSLLDGRPNAIMEANACGVPVIGAPVGGIPELIRDNENGMLVAPDDVALFLRTLRVCVAVTAASVLAGYVIALLWVRGGPVQKLLVELCILIPFWISVLTRAFGWLALLSNRGIINDWLQWAGILHEPLAMVRNEFGVIVGMTHFLIPFAVFPLASSMRNLDERVLMAARGMGASRARIFWRVLVPMTLPGILGAALVVFVFALGFFVTPAILGGGRSVMAAELIYLRIFQSPDWGLGAAISVIMMVAVGGMLALLLRQARPGGGR